MRKQQRLRLPDETGWAEARRLGVRLGAITLIALLVGSLGVLAYHYLRGG